MTSLCNTLQLSHRPCLRQGSDLTCPSHYTSQQGLQSSPAWSDLSSGINSYSFSLLYVLNLEVSSNWNIASRHYFFLKSKKSKREFDCNSMTIYAGEEYFNDKSFSNIRPLILFHWYRVLYIQSIKNLFFFFSSWFISWQICMHRCPHFLQSLNYTHSKSLVFHKLLVGIANL